MLHIPIKQMTGVRPQNNKIGLPRAVRVSGVCLALALAAPLLITSPSIAEPEIVFDATDFDWGPVEEGSIASHSFPFWNAGDTPLEIWEVESHCECTVPSVSAEVIPPGESGEVIVTFDSARLSGKITKEVFVRSNDPVQPEIVLHLYAVVMPGMLVDPPSVDLGKVSLAGGNMKTLKLVSQDGTPFQVKELRTGLPFLHARVLEPPDGEPATSVTIEIQASKDGAPGPFRDFLIVSTNHPRRQKIEVPLKGEVESLFRLEPSRLAFGTATANSSRLGEITITYVGEGDVSLLEAVPDTPSLRVDLDPYPAGNGGHLYVSLTDQAGVGRLSGSVTVKTDSPQQPTLEIKVLGFVRR